MRRTLQEKLNVKKAARFAVVINALQIAAMVAVLLYAVLRARLEGRVVEIGAIAAALLIVSWGAVLDIREALSAGKIAEQASMLEEAYGQLEALNGTLRKQRHDFMNHLQVVFSLLELDDPGEAMKYVENVYGDIKKTGSVLKTAIPAVNALIAAKRQDCAERGITLDIHIAAGWRDMPVPGWEMCRVLGNLIDNARDALVEDASNADKRISLTIDETPGAYCFRVENNGPAIPPAIQRSIFQMGFTTKSDGHGSGLSIVEEILKEYGGEIHVESAEDATAFIGSVPKRMDIRESERIE
ncbi:MAG: Spo0B domain-containing protein [Clostridia bacterium]|nr:Spo0B domain-containing protein [Clostridia bacterium]